MGIPGAVIFWDVIRTQRFAYFVSIVYHCMHFLLVLLEQERTISENSFCCWRHCQNFIFLYTFIVGVIVRIIFATTLLWVFLLKTFVRLFLFCSHCGVCLWCMFTQCWPSDFNYCHSKLANTGRKSTIRRRISTYYNVYSVKMTTL